MTWSGRGGANGITRPVPDDTPDQRSRIRAERRLGELLAVTTKDPGGQPRHRKSTGSKREPVKTPTLAESGIDKKLSSRAQKLAKRRLGELLKDRPMRTAAHSRGGGSKGSKREPLPNAPPTLAESGIDKLDKSTSAVVGW